jgi:uncharacterized phage protein (TIGR01671 family)
MIVNREIKFRVWDNLKKEWLTNKNIWRMKTDNDGIGMILPPIMYWKQHPQGLNYQQYTGLKDKNGREIYEGDFIKYSHPSDEQCVVRNTKNIVLVRWTEEHEDNHPGFRIVDLCGQYGEMEVIGNIYQNPELL